MSQFRSLDPSKTSLSKDPNKTLNWTFEVVLLFSYQSSLFCVVSFDSQRKIYYHNGLWTSSVFLIFFYFNIYVRIQGTKRGINEYYCKIIHLPLVIFLSESLNRTARSGPYLWPLPGSCDSNSPIFFLPERMSAGSVLWNCRYRLFSDCLRPDGSG